MLAVTAFVLTLLVLAVIAAIVGFFVFKPAWDRVSKACDKVDDMHAMQESDRKLAEAELDGELSDQLHAQNKN